MSIAESIRAPFTEPRELHSGDHMSAEQFHRIYSLMPKNFKAELVGGVVYVASPLGYEHSVFDGHLGTLLGLYARMTPGTASGHNATVRLSEFGEPQPDLFLRILTECGGQSKIENNFIVGAPELIAEIAHSTWSIDLKEKYHDYRTHGVREYLVLDLHAKRLRWFDLPADKELAPDADGIMRIKQFPGLWLNAAAIVAGEFPSMKSSLEAGMASGEYAAFAKQLASRKQ